ncbi:hypothetical protein D9M69_535050 [compost metagenome]
MVQAFDLGAHFHAQLGVQVGQRLVEQEQLRVARQRPAHGHALALAARELGRAAVQQVLDLQHARHLVDALVAIGLGHLAHLQREADVVGHRHGRVERVALEHHGDVALGGRHTDHVLARDVQLAFGRLFEPGNDVEQGGLAAARGADQDQELARLDVNVDALEHLDRLVALAKRLADALDVQRRSHCFYPLTAPAVRPLRKY